MIIKCCENLNFTQLDILMEIVNEGVSGGLKIRTKGKIWKKRVCMDNERKH